NVTELKLDAAGMVIDSVSTIPPHSVAFYQPKGGQECWITTAGSSFQQGDTVTLVVSYTTVSSDNRGFFLFPKGRIAENLPDGTRAVVEERLAYTMSEPEDARYWMPCNDHPYDKAMTAISVRVPAPFSVASNGLLQDVEDLGDGTRVYRWKSFSPMT